MAFTLLAQIGPAQEPTPPVPSPARDYAKAFEQLVALGLPPLDASAKWVKSGSVYNDYHLRNGVKGYRGNAWLAGEGKTAILVPLGAVESQPSRGASPPSDVEKDAGLILAVLKKLDLSGTDGEDTGFDLSDGTLALDFLVFATQLHQTGRKDLANQICAALFAASPDPESVIDGVVGRIAFAGYNRAVAAFRQSGDWAAYHRALMDLAVKFPRGWNAWDEIKALAERVKPQAEGAQPPALTLPGVELSARALAFVAKFNQMQKAEGAPASPDGDGPGRPAVDMDDFVMRHGFPSGSRYGGLNSNWLFTQQDAEAAGDPLQGLLALGMESVPVLAAMLGDSLLTMRTGSPDSTIERPLSRGEIARDALITGLPMGATPDDDDDTLREKALAFHKEFGAAGREELVIHFLRNGTREHMREAMRLLASSPNPAAHAAFEEYVLALDSVFEVHAEVRTYLKNRKKEGQPFFDRFAEVARAQAPADSEDEDGPVRMDYRLRELGGVENMLKMLHAAVDTEGPRAMVTSIAKGDPAKAQAAIHALRAGLQDTPSGERHIYWMRGANLATNASVRVMFLLQIVNSRAPDSAPGQTGGETVGQEPPDGEGGTPEATVGNRPSVRNIPEGEAKVWRKLMADTRKPGEETGDEAESNGAEGEVDASRNDTVGDLACLALLKSVQNSAVHDLFRASQILERPKHELAREAATARLAGREPDWPDASRVTPERLQAIIAQAGGMKTGDIPAFIKGLSPDERAAWKEWFPTVLETGDAPEPVLGLTRWVRRHVNWSDGRVPAMGDGSKLLNRVPPGFELTPGWIQNHLRDLATAEKPTPPCWLIFQSLPGDGQLGVCEFVLAASTSDAPGGDGSTGGQSKDGENGAEEEGQEDEEDASDKEDPDDRRFWARSVLPDARRALASHPAAFGAATLKAFDAEEEESSSLTLLVARDGTLSVAKDPDQAVPPAAAPLAAIRAIFPKGPFSMGLSFLTRAHADTIFKDIPLSGEAPDE